MPVGANARLSSGAVPPALMEPQRENRDSLGPIDIRNGRLGPVDQNGLPTPTPPKKRKGGEAMAVLVFRNK